MVVDGYSEGQPIRIVAGLYKSQKTGTYMKAHGTKMCFVNVDGSGIRKVRLTSILPATESTSPSTTEQAAKDDTEAANDDVITISRSEYQTLLIEIDFLSNDIRRLQLRVNQMDKMRKN